MKTFNIALGLTLLLAGVASNSALADKPQTGRSGHASHSGGGAHHRHPGHGARTRIFITAPLFAPWYYLPFGYYDAAPLPAEPQLYIEQDPAAPGAVRQHYYWYYCAESQAYYSDVEDCPGGWQPVEAEMPPPS